MEEPTTDQAFLDKIKTLQFKTSRKGSALTPHYCKGPKCPTCNAPMIPGPKFEVEVPGATLGFQAAIHPPFKGDPENN